MVTELGFVALLVAGFGVVAAGMGMLVLRLSRRR